MRPKAGRSGLAPLGFVIPGSNVIFQFQPVEDRFGFPQRGIVSVIGEIARNDYEAQSRRRIDLIDGMSQVVGGQRIGRDVQIAHQRKNGILPHGPTPTASNKTANNILFITRNILNLLQR